MPSIESFPSDPVTKRQALLDAVEQIRDTLSASASESEQQATLSMDAITALNATGMFRLKLPEVLGGAESDPILQMEVIEALAAIDTASAWCVMVGATSVALLGANLPEAGLPSVFVDGQAPLASTSFFPAGVAISEDGGYRLEGHWRFCSGIRHAEWISVAATVQQSNGSKAPSTPSQPPEVIFLAVPVRHITIVDNWQVMGLKGTGSCDVSISDHFVPQPLTFNWDRTNPLPERGGKLYRLPVLAFVACEHIAFALGVARRALDELIHQAEHTKGAYRTNPLKERQVIHRLVGKFDLELSAARSLAFKRYRTAWQIFEADTQIDGASAIELQSIAAYVTELAIKIATAAFRYGGGGALYQPNILERLMRDIQAAAQHITVSDAAYELHGKHLLGLNDG